jgi:hypothetical protein
MLTLGHAHMGEVAAAARPEPQGQKQAQVQALAWRQGHSGGREVGPARHRHRHLPREVSLRLLVSVKVAGAGASMTECCSLRTLVSMLAVVLGRMMPSGQAGWGKAVR